MSGTERGFRWLGSIALALLFAEPSLAREIGPFEASLGDGLVLEDAARDLQIDLDGRFAADWVEYDDRNTRDSGVRLDRALLGASVRYGDALSARVLADLDGIDTRYGLWEAWVSAEPRRWLRFTAGLLRIPLGVEHQLPEGSYPFVGFYGFPAFLTGRTDLGLRVDGEIAEGLLSYDLTAAAGEGFDLFGQKRGDPQLAGRVTSHPLRWVDWSVEVGPYTIPLVSGLFASFAYAWTPDYDARLDVANPLRNKLFLTDRLDADSSRFWHFGYGIDLGPVRVVHEFAQGSLLDVLTPSGERVDLEDQITSWQILGSWMLTGEHYDSRPYRLRDQRRVIPDRPLDGVGSARGFGALELAVRYANADIDREFFTLGLTSEDISSQEFRVFTAAVNWYPTSYLRATVEVTRTIADQRPAVFDSHGRDTSGVVRVQYTF